MRFHGLYYRKVCRKLNRLVRFFDMGRHAPPGMGRAAGRFLAKVWVPSSCSGSGSLLGVIGNRPCPFRSGFPFLLPWKRPGDSGLDGDFAWTGARRQALASSQLIWDDWAMMCLSWDGQGRQGRKPHLAGGRPRNQRLRLVPASLVPGLALPSGLEFAVRMGSPSGRPLDRVQLVEETARATSGWFNTAWLADHLRQSRPGKHRAWK